MQVDQQFSAVSQLGAHANISQMQEQMQYEQQQQQQQQAQEEVIQNNE